MSDALKISTGPIIGITYLASGQFFSSLCHTTVKMIRNCSFILQNVSSLIFKGLWKILESYQWKKYEKILDIVIFSIKEHMKNDFKKNVKSI